MSALQRDFVERTVSATTKPIENVGQPYPVGATLVPGGVNFSVYSRDASDIELLFFDREDDARPARVIRIDPVSQRKYHYWHAFVAGVQPGQIYGFRAHGRFDPDRTVSALTLPNFSSTRMAAPLWFRKTTVAPPRVQTVITRRWR